MQHGFKTWAEHKAIEQRRLLGLDANMPLPARQLATSLSITVVSPEHIPGMTRGHLDCLLRRDQSSWSAITMLIRKKRPVGLALAFSLPD